MIYGESWVPPNPAATTVIGTRTGFPYTVVVFSTGLRCQDCAVRTARGLHLKITTGKRFRRTFYLCVI